MNPSLFIQSPVVHGQVILVASAWHRRAKLGAFGWWRPDGCTRDPAAEIQKTRQDAPGAGNMCRACWPVWPPTR